VGEPEVCVLDVGLVGVALDPQRLVVVSHRRCRCRAICELSALFFLSTVWSVGEETGYDGSARGATIVGSYNPVLFGHGFKLVIVSYRPCLFGRNCKLQ
jgi:hypothetical protein